MIYFIRHGSTDWNENKDEFIDSIFTEFTEYYKVHSSDNRIPSYWCSQY